jgi:hypothetical protein
VAHPPESHDDLGYLPKEELSIGVVKKDLLGRGAASSDVVERARKLEAWPSRHASTVRISVTSLEGKNDIVAPP